MTSALVRRFEKSVTNPTTDPGERLNLTDALLFTSLLKP